MKINRTFFGLTLRASAQGAALLLVTGLMVSAHAQKTYRCGNTYQSMPCSLSDGKGGTSTHPGAIVTTAGAAVAAPPTEEEKKLAAAKAAEEAEAKKKAAAAAEKKTKCDKINNELNYNTAQSRSGGSQTTMDRLNADRRKINDDLRQAGC